jgi:hypothetical protein
MKPKMEYKGKNYQELWNFITSFFGDYWEGRTENDILDEAISMSSTAYITEVYRQLQEFLEIDIPVEKKKKFVLSTNVYVETGDKAVEWLVLLKSLIEAKISSAE